MAVTIISFRNEGLFERLLLSVDAVLHHGQWWRMLTSGLVHADYPHLLANMFSLFYFGLWLEHAVHSWRFGMLYGIGVLVASYTSVYLYRNAVDYRAVGASGGVCAVVGGATVIFPDSSLIIFPLPIPIPGWLFAASFVMYSIIGSREQWDNVGHAAHLGGTLFGLGLMAAFYPQLALEHWYYMLAVVGAGVGAFAWLRFRKTQL